MAIDLFQTLDVIETLENYIDKIRPPEEMRDKYDISYKIEDQSVIIFELREHWKNKAEKLEIPIAKATYVKRQDFWKLLWQRSDLKWHVYDPKPTVKSIKKFVEVVEKDEHHCFWG